MQYRSLFLFSSALALAIAAGCSNEGDDTTIPTAGAAGKAGASGKGGSGGAEAGAKGEAGNPSTPGSAGEGGEAGAVTAFKTLDGTQPLVIGHRGLPGLHPEETEVSYTAAAEAGADSLEEDLHLTKDCVLVARHNPWLSDNTNVATVAATNPTIAALKRTKPGEMIPVTYDYTTVGGPATYLSDTNDPLHELVVDGEEHVNDWSITDFTLAQLKLLGGTTYDDAAQRPTAENGVYPILTMQEIIDLQKTLAKKYNRTITVYPESKNPYWNNEQAKANGCGTGDHPFEDAILKLINDNDLNSADAPIFVQSFDPTSLQYFRSAGLKTKVVQLIDADDYDLKTGKMIYTSNDAYNFIDGRPYSWTVSGKADTFGDLLTKDGLAEVKKYADGIGPWKPQVMSWSVSPYPTTAGFKPSLPGDVNTVTSTGVLKDAHDAGLFVHVYTFRNETQYLAAYYNQDPIQEFLTFYREGVDGVFTDFANTGVAARDLFLKETGH